MHLFREGPRLRVDMVQIIMGGGAQVGQVAIGAISEADRHNIRGEHISIDTIPLVGEAALAEAVRAVARLPRAKALVLATALSPLPAPSSWLRPLPMASNSVRSNAAFQARGPRLPAAVRRRSSK